MLNTPWSELNGQEKDLICLISQHMRDYGTVYLSQNIIYLGTLREYLKYPKNHQLDGELMRIGAKLTRLRFFVSVGHNKWRFNTPFLVTLISEMTYWTEQYLPKPPEPVKPAEYVDCLKHAGMI